MQFLRKRAQPVQLLFVTLLLILLLQFQVFAQESAQVLTLNETVSGTLGVGNLSDVYIFVGLQNDTISLQATSPDLPFSMVVTDTQGTTLGESSSAASGDVALSGITLNQTGTYLVTVFTSPGTSVLGGDYEITLLQGAIPVVENTAEAEATDVVAATAPADTANGATSVPQAATIAETPAETPEPDVTEVVAATPIEQPTAEVVDDSGADTTITTTPVPLDFEAPTDILIQNGIEVSLQWEAPVDLNLEVRDPRGNTLFFDNRTTPINGSFGFDANGLCQVLSPNPVETATWQPGFLPTGSYEILVFYRQPCEGSPTVDFTIDTTVNGVALETVQATLTPPIANQNSVYIANFIVNEDTSATINDGGLYPDASLNQLLLPPEELIVAAEPIPRDVVVSDAIFGEQDFLTFSFDAVAEEVITINLSTVSGNLDPLLQLIDQNGNLIDVNDDANEITRNASISNLRIVVPGTYTIIATRYGKDIGGTEGEFELVVTGSTNTLPDAVVNSNLPVGDVQVFLTWSTNHDLQLLVRDPVGESVFDDVPRVSSGGLLAADGNAACTLSDGPPVSYIYWPTGLLRQGAYETEVWFQNTCNDTQPVEFTLTIIVNGEVIAIENQSPTIGQRFLLPFDVFADGTAQAGQGGFVGDEEFVLDFRSETPLPILPNQPVNGSITRDNDFDVYSFEGTAGQVVTISLRATSGTLDTILLLLDPGSIRVARNDDIDEALAAGTQGRETDSLINAFTLPANGQYLILATRFGSIFGATTGGYSLTLQTN